MGELIDRQALKDYVSSLSTHPLNEWDTWGVLAAIDKQPTITAPRWRRVEEELPEIGKSVLVCDSGYYWLATRTDDEVWQGRRYWKNTDGEWDRIEKDTYWMPIEPPQEDANGNP